MIPLFKKKNMIPVRENSEVVIIYPDICVGNQSKHNDFVSPMGCSKKEIVKIMDGH